MIAKLVTRHRFSDAPRHSVDKLFLGIGGAGREGARTAYLQERAFYGKACPYSAIAEVDLCGDTGRGIEPTFVPDDPGALHRLILPGVNCTALVDAHGRYHTFPMWAAVDPEQIAEIKDTAKLGGYANPQVARAVEELYASMLDEFLRLVVRQIEVMRRTPVPGWERAGGPLHIFVFASQNGAVGSTALHVVDRLAPRLTPPFRIVFMPLLLADQGRVTDRAVASALQHAGLTEIQQRARGRHE
jgi:hypothetical protein